jgi:phosphoenolpyruvate-protein kinase (PTS system EI component)
MFPMVTTVEEVRRARALVAEAAAGVRPGLPAADVPVGIMVEVPAAALRTRHLAGEVDFVSIGTNDLTQYALAVDRGNPLVAGLGDGLDPAVLELIAAVVHGARPQRRPVAVCGAMAADLLAVPVLVGLGITALSVPPAAVAEVKAVVREVDASAARDLAERVLSLESAAAVRRELQAGARP